MNKKSIKIEYYYCTVKTNNKYTFVIIDNRISLLFRNRLKRISFNYLLHLIKYKEICFIYYGKYDTVKIKEAGEKDGKTYNNSKHTENNKRPEIRRLCLHNR